MLESALV
jgi:hypothetical protein